MRRRSLAEVNAERRAAAAAVATGGSATASLSGSLSSSASLSSPGSASPSPLATGPSRSDGPPPSPMSPSPLLARRPRTSAIRATVAPAVEPRASNPIALPGESDSGSDSDDCSEVGNAAAHGRRGEMQNSLDSASAAHDTVPGTGTTEHTAAVVRRVNPPRGARAASARLAGVAKSTRNSTALSDSEDELMRHREKPRAGSKCGAASESRSSDSSSSASVRSPVKRRAAAKGKCTGMWKEEEKEKENMSARSYSGRHGQAAKPKRQREDPSSAAERVRLASYFAAVDDFDLTVRSFKH